MIADGLDEQALLGLSGYNGRAAVAAPEQARAAIELQVAFFLAVAMTLEAIVRQQRPDLFFEELDALC